ncbi:hypothetical protein CRENBAI_011679 [Crenichthys baileyi]|uniref:Uncharacterized protein n=1 Tax=Crenichthys baileyi TaxID=28760 RepID=A0AAV9SBW5_9TELE
MINIKNVGKMKSLKEVQFIHGRPADSDPTFPKNKRRIFRLGVSLCPTRPAEKCPFVPSCSHPSALIHQHLHTNENKENAWKELIFPLKSTRTFFFYQCK